MAEVCGLSPKGGRGMAINRLIYLLLLIILKNSEAPTVRLKALKNTDVKNKTKNPPTVHRDRPVVELTKS